MHTRHLTHDHFNAEMYDLYFQFLTERQRIWVRRAHLEMTRPWTTDRTLNYEFITNAYRELDPGTEYVLDVIGTADESHIDKIFNIMVYRLMGSQIATHASLGFLHHDTFSVKKYLRSLGEVSGNIFGDAYRVAGYGEGAGSKKQNVGELLKELADNLPEWHRRMINSPNARELFNVFASIKGFGTFLSNQCMVDVLMLDELSDERVWSFGTDEWCEPGPGAKRGMTKLLAPGVKPANLHMVMAWLRDSQEAEFERLGLQFPYLLNSDDSIKRLTVCNIQTTLCEFSKYVRSRGHVNVRAYTNVPSKLQPFDICLSDDEIEQLRDITAVTAPESMYQSRDVELETELMEHTPVTLNGGVSFAHPISVASASAGETITWEPAPLASPILPAPTVPPIDLASIAHLLQGAQRNDNKPIVVPVDPTGLLGLPKAMLIVPIW